jgi:hypothetical protein
MPDPGDHDAAISVFTLAGIRTGLCGGLLLPTALRYGIPLVNPRIAFPIDRLSLTTYLVIYSGAAVLAGGGLLLAALRERSQSSSVVVDEQGVRQVNSRGVTTWHSAWAWLRASYSPDRKELVLHRGAQALTISGGTITGPLVAIQDLSALRAAIGRHTQLEIARSAEAREAGRRGFVYGCIATASAVAYLFLTPLVAEALGKERYSMYWALAVLGPLMMLFGGVQWASGRGGLKSNSENWPPPVMVFVVVTLILIGASVL